MSHAHLAPVASEGISCPPQVVPWYLGGDMVRHMHIDVVTEKFHPTQHDTDSAALRLPQYVPGPTTTCCRLVEAQLSYLRPCAATQWPCSGNWLTTGDVTFSVVMKYMQQPGSAQQLEGLTSEDSRSAQCLTAEPQLHSIRWQA